MSEFDKQTKKNYFDSAEDSDEEAEISNQETPGSLLSKEEVDKLVDELKNKGNEYYKNSDFDEALKAYTDAINFLKNNKLEKNSVLLLNRSATFLALKRYVPALNDANQAIELNPNTWKGHWRKGVALMAMSQRMFRTKQAIEAFESCKNCSDLPSNKTKEVDAELWKAKRRMAEQEAQSPPPDLMSVTGKRGAGIPIILLHDATGGIVTIELKNGCMYRGILEDAQDNMNCLIKNCIKVSPEGIQSNIEVAYVRGSQIHYIILPKMLQKAPFFNRIKLFRKFKGHAVYGANTLPIGPGRGPFGPRPGGGRGGAGPIRGSQTLPQGAPQNNYYGPQSGHMPPRGPPSSGPSHNYRY